MDYIQPLREQLGEQHPLLQLVCQCLHNTPAQRPSVEELLQQLEAARPQIDRTYAWQQAGESGNGKAAGGHDECPQNKGDN